jgi:hydroxymethylglutaryl-CoA synthase
MTIGIMSVNACYGGTAALLNSVAWMESSAWDGRYAIVIMTDYAVYPEGAARATGGAGAVALLIAPKAAITLEPVRSSFMDDVYDLYKPDLRSDYPVFDREEVTNTYLDCLSNCYKLLKDKYSKIYKEVLSVHSFDSIVFHSPYKKLVFKAFLKLCHLDL